MSAAVTTTPGAPPIIRMEGVNKWYDSFQVLTDINLSVRQGERIV
ncbi:MAG: glutamine ABC transporter ATP-binding protein GlnQ, partial [Gammaproteobacteria bacterium]|nr:glutamine ABC transporter ATP-binding protein GlnQ [Gammaproteobacteria bacterium]